MTLNNVEHEWIRLDFRTVMEFDLTLGHSTTELTDLFMSGERFVPLDYLPISSPPHRLKTLCNELKNRRPYYVVKPIERSFSILCQHSLYNDSLPSHCCVCRRVERIAMNEMSPKFFDE